MNANDSRLTGLNPLAYTGVEATNPAAQQVSRNDRDPGQNDYKGFYLGDLWINETDNTVWILTNMASNVATWAQLETSSGLALQYVTDSGSAYPLNSVLNVLGDSIIETSASGNTITTSLVNGANGQVLIGGGTASVWANVTSAGGTVSISNGPNSIDIEAVSNLSTSLEADDSGLATELASVINLYGGSNFNTASDGVNTLTINLDNTISIATSLTLDSLTAGVMQTSAGGVISSTNGTDGQVLIGGGAAPAWANITSSGGTITITNGANTIDLSKTYDKAPFAYIVQTVNGLADDAWQYLGEDKVLTALTSSADFYVGDGAGTKASYTAPVTGKYYICFDAMLDIKSGYWNRDVRLKIETPSRDYINRAVLDQYNIGYEIGRSVSVCIDLTAGQVCYFAVYVSNASPWGATTFDIDKAFISGYLID